MDYIHSDYQYQIIWNIYYHLSEVVNLNLLQSYILEQKSIDKIIIYGSRVKGSDSDESDLDIIIVGNKFSHEKDIIHLKDFLESIMNNMIPLDITLYDFHSNKVYYQTFGSDLVNEQLFENKMNKDLTHSFFQTECFHLNGKNIKYDNNMRLHQFQVTTN